MSLQVRNLPIAIPTQLSSIQQKSEQQSCCKSLLDKIASIIWKFIDCVKYIFCCGCKKKEISHSQSTGSKEATTPNITISIESPQTKPEKTKTIPIKNQEESVSKAFTRTVEPKSEPVSQSLPGLPEKPTSVKIPEKEETSSSKMNDTSVKESESLMGEMKKAKEPLLYLKALIHLLADKKDNLSINKKGLVDLLKNIPGYNSQMCDAVQAVLPHCGSEDFLLVEEIALMTKQSLSAISAMLIAFNEKIQKAQNEEELSLLKNLRISCCKEISNGLSELEFILRVKLKNMPIDFASLKKARAKIEDKMMQLNVLTVPSLSDGISMHGVDSSGKKEGTHTPQEQSEPISSVTKPAKPKKEEAKTSQDVFDEQLTGFGSAIVTSAYSPMRLLSELIGILEEKKDNISISAKTILERLEKKAERPSPDKELELMNGYLQIHGEVKLIDEIFKTMTSFCNAVDSTLTQFDGKIKEAKAKDQRQNLNFLQTSKFRFCEEVTKHLSDQLFAVRKIQKEMPNEALKGVKARLDTLFMEVNSHKVVS